MGNPADEPSKDPHRRVGIIMQTGVVTRQMRRILDEIQNGEFAREFILENQAGAATLKAKRRIGREHPIEEVGEKLRGMMSWINEGKIVDKSIN